MDCRLFPWLPASGRCPGEGAHRLLPRPGAFLGLRAPFPSLPEGFSYSRDAITKEELQSISEKIYRADINKAQKEDIILNSQNRISPSETRDHVDRCPEP